MHVVLPEAPDEKLQQSGRHGPGPLQIGGTRVCVYWQSPLQSTGVDRPPNPRTQISTRCRKPVHLDFYKKKDERCVRLGA